VKYRLLDQTSDLEMEIFGRDLPELFRNACFAVFDNMVGQEDGAGGAGVQGSKAESRRIELHSTTREELFLDWLRELLFRFSTEYFVVKEVVSMKLTGGQGSGNADQGSTNGEPESWQLAAEVRGEKFDPKRHRVKIEIKTPTYHMFSIAKDDTGYKALVLFDV